MAELTRIPAGVFFNGVASVARSIARTVLAMLFLFVSQKVFYVDKPGRITINFSAFYLACSNQITNIIKGIAGYSSRFFK